MLDDPKLDDIIQMKVNDFNNLIEENKKLQKENIRLLNELNKRLGLNLFQQEHFNYE